MQTAHAVHTFGDNAAWLIPAHSFIIETKNMGGKDCCRTRVESLSHQLGMYLWMVSNLLSCSG